jgi:hypothetical protein
VECEELKKGFDHSVSVKGFLRLRDERVSSAQRLGLAWIPVTDPRVKPEDWKERALTLALAQVREYAPPRKKGRGGLFLQIDKPRE